MKPIRGFLQRCFPILYCKSIEELIKCAVLIPDLKNPVHLLRMGLLLLILLLTTVSGLRIERFKGYSFWVNDSLGFSGQIVFLGAAAFMSEYFISRLWLYSRHVTRRTGFLDLANQTRGRTLTHLLVWFRISVINVFIVGTAVMLANFSCQFIYESTTQGKMMLILFFAIWLIFIILHANDMLIMYFTAFLGVLFIRRQLAQLRIRLSLISSSAPDVVFEVAHLRRSMRQMREIAESVRHLNSLVMCLMVTNRMVVTPAASVAVFLFLAALGNSATRFVQIIMAIAFAVYVTRGYTLTLALSIVSSEIRKLHTSLASLVANRHVCLLTKIHLLTVMQNLDENTNQFVIREITGPITQFDVLESILVTLQFTVLLFDFAKRL